MKTLEQLRSDLTKALGAMDAFQKGIVDAEGKPRDMTAEEIAALDKHVEGIESLEKQIEAVEKAARTSARLNGKPADGSDSHKVAAEARAEPGKFKSLGEQLVAVAKAGMNSGDRPAVDPRLQWEMIKASGANEAIPSEGGFLVQTDFSTALFGLMHEQGEVLRRVTRIPLSQNSNGIKLPTIDETSRADGSRWGGIRAYWANEAATVTASKPALAEIELKLQKCMGIGYMTDELMADAPAMETVFRNGFAEEITFKTEDAFINGTGSGQPLGIINANATIVVEPESGQATSTLRSGNILDMWQRLGARYRKNAVWLINQDCERQLHAMELGTQGTHMYVPPGMNGQVLANTPFATLLGRPVLPVEYCASVGTKGDIILADLGRYLMIDKGGVDWNESMHVRFLYDEMAFRITYRVDGQPSLKSAITPKNGSISTSAYVVLNTRT